MSYTLIVAYFVTYFDQYYMYLILFNDIHLTCACAAVHMQSNITCMHEGDHELNILLLYVYTIIIILNI